MKKFTMLLMCLSIFGIYVASAQNRTITGTVTSSEDNMGLPGVSVTVKGTTIGAATDIDGKYSLSVPQDATILVFSSVGMKTQEITIGASNSVSVVMEPNTIDVDEVMVVAYGTAKKKTFTGSAKKVEGEKLEMKGTSEITKALAGEASGVQVISGSGQPGSNAKVRIRGYGSVNASRAPLYVVDGVPYDGDISSINPSDIANSTVLKDASAAALYGSRGANGVILITTKKGKRGKSEVQVDVKTGINMRLLPKYEVIDDQEEFVELVWDGLNNNRKALSAEFNSYGIPWGEDIIASKLLFDDWGYGIPKGYNMWKAKSDSLIDPATGKFRQGIERLYTPESWEENIFKAKEVYDIGVKFSGANEKSSHYTSFNFRNDKGYYINSSFKRLNARSNLNQEVKSWLSTGLNMSYSYMEYSQPGQGGNMNNGFAFVNGMPSLFPVFNRDKNGEKIEDELIGGYQYDYGQLKNRPFGWGVNPAGALQLDKDLTQSNQVEVNPNLKITFLKDFTFTTRLGAQYLMSDNNSMTNLFYGDAEGIGRASRTHVQKLSYTWNQILNWSHSFDIHNLSAFVGHEVNAMNYKYMYGGMSKLADPYNSELSNGIIKDGLSSYTSKYALESYIAQFKYDYDEKYFFQINYRRDGTSRFPEDAWGNFGSVGLAWLVNKESFMENLSWLRELKLKASYGILGNQSLGSFYPTLDLYSVANLNRQIALLIGGKGNKDLTWEQSKTLNFGVDFNIKGIIEGGIEYFTKNTDNLLFYQQVSPALGYNSMPINGGVLNNAGIELELLAHVVNTNDFKVNINLNASRYSNELKEMPLGADGKTVHLEQHGLFAYQEGRSLYDFYMREYAGVNQETGAPQWYTYYDTETGKIVDNLEDYKHNNPNAQFEKKITEVYDDATLAYIDKSIIPEVLGGFGFDVYFKGVKLMAQFAYSIGGYAYDGSYAALMHNKAQGGYNWHIDMRNRWTPDNTNTDIPKLMTHGDVNYDKANATSSRFLTKKSFLNLSTVNLSYTFPKNILDKLRLGELTIFANGDNLFLLSARKGFNPMMYETGGSDSYGYAPLTTVTGGIKLKF